MLTHAPSRPRRRQLSPAIDFGPGTHPVLQRVYAARGVHDEREIANDLVHLPPPAALLNCTAAGDRLAAAVQRGERLLVVGDFDTDGATGAALAVSVLRAMGAAVTYRVPDRQRHGYGLSPALIGEIVPAKPDVLITVDHGIACHDGIAAARAAGIEVIVTDHHLPGTELPPASLIVNPRQSGDKFPGKALAGVGVMFYVLAATRRALDERGWFNASRPAPRLADWLDLVALGTVADMVPFDHLNRILVAHGLRRIRAGRCRPGIRALFDVAGRDIAQCRAAALGWSIAPRLNAAGRLDDMALGVECLLAAEGAADELAVVLDGINRDRRERQAAMQDEAWKKIEADIEARSAAAESGLPPVICVNDPGWHPGLIGLIAGRLKDRLGRPVIALAPAAPGSGEYRGSARSVPGLHIRDFLVEVARLAPGVMSRYGGHAMAAGLTLAAGDLERFIQAIAAAAQGTEIPADILWSDGPLTAGEIDLDLAHALDAAGPWGQHFEEPLFDNPFSISRRRAVNGGHLQLWLQHNPGGPEYPAIAFGAAGDPILAAAERAHLAYHVKLDRWQGEARLKLHIEGVWEAASL